MKKIWSVALLITLVLSLLLLTGCDFLCLFSCDEKQVPVYKGMNITALNRTAENSAGSNGIAFNENYSGNTTDSEVVFNKNNPFPNSDKTIEEVIESSVNVPGAVDSIFYASANQDIYINVHFYNPDCLEIVSLTLNGKTYTSDTFDSASDSDTVYIKQNVGTAGGILEYEISDIKYVSGEETSDVIMDGNKTVLAGVRSSDSVSASITDVSLSTNSFSVNLDVIDSDGLVAFSKGKVKAILYDGEKIVANEDITVGSNFLKFTNLKTHTPYQYAIVAYYDDLSGLGFGMHVIHTDAFITDSVVLFSDVKVNNDGIDFDFSWHKEHEGKLITALYLYQNGEQIKMFSGRTRSIKDTNSKTDYTLVAEYMHNGTMESIAVDFTTLEKSAPEISLSFVNNTRTSIEFGITKTDVDNVGNITLIELLLDGSVIAEISGEDIETKRVFENLTNDTTYTVRVSYAYDLRDGNGEHTKAVSLDMSTVSVIPKISIVERSKTQTGFCFDIEETDIFDYGRIASIALLHGASVVEEDESGTIRSYEGLLSNNEYTVIVTYVYDLRDGSPEETVTKSITVTTYAKTAPDIKFENPAKTQTGITFDVTAFDPDGIANIDYIELFLDGALKVAEDLTGTARGFEGLLSDNDYLVALTYSYDLNDGTTRTTETKILTLRTDARTAPEINIPDEFVSVTKNSIGFEIHEIDKDDIGIISEIKLIYAGGEIPADSLDQRLFEGLAPYTDYTIWLKYLYDLNDGDGTHEIIKELSVKTEHYLGIQEFIIGKPAFAEGDTISLKIKLDNPNAVIAKSVVINGVTYSVKNATKDEILVDILCDSSFVGGETTLSLEQIIGSYGGEDVTLKPDGEPSCEVFINGTIEILDLSFVNADFEPIDWARPRDTVYLLITLNNPTGYEIKGFTGYDGERWYCPVALNYGWNTVTVGSLDYSNEYVAGSISFPAMTSSFYRVKSDDTKYVSTPDQLKNMAGGYYYELANDIDLSGIEWIASDFDGVFDGKGYTLKNISEDLTVTSSDAYVGLFCKGTGIIYSLNLDGVSISIEASSDNDNVYNVFAGGLVAYGSSLSIYDCSITNSTVKAENLNGNAYAGGFVGYATDLVIIDSTSGAAVSATYSAGGLAGYAKYAVIENCENTGDIGYKITSDESEDSLGLYSAGGLVGYISDGSIYASKNSGDIGFALYCGGIAGSANDSNIDGCHNGGDVVGTYSSGGLVGNPKNTVVTDSTNSGTIKASGGA